MNQKILVILPLQLFDPSSWTFNSEEVKTVYIVEENHYFTRLPFHKQKLAYQRACMKQYQLELKYQIPDISIKYINYKDVKKSWYSELNSKYGQSLIYFDPIDKEVQTLLKKQLSKATILPTLNFWVSNEEMKLFTRNKRYSFTSLYQYQKDKLVSMFEKKTDFGLAKSKSQDKYNRNKIIKSEVPKKSILSVEQNEITKEALSYTARNFKDNYGSLNGKILYPYTKKQAVTWLRHFLSHKLTKFGKYQDAIDTSNPFLYHSVISPMLNVGILTDTIVVNELVKFLYKIEQKIPIQSLEAFVRQVIGWRNYVYLVYVQEPHSLYKSNILNHHNKIGKAIWEGKTGIEVIDKHIKLLDETSYLSHIPRLMIMGNFMLLLQIDPVQVLDWFTTMFIDSCDTLMVPNIIMSQYNSPILMTRFYISSFNYIQQMSNEKYPDSDKHTWDRLFQGFLLKHQKLGLSSYVYASTTKKLLALSESQKRTIKRDADDIITLYTR